MRILDTQVVVITEVKSSDGEYLRFGKNCWFQLLGCSYEDVSDCAKLEEAYQKHIKGELL